MKSKTALLILLIPLFMACGFFDGLLPDLDVRFFFNENDTIRYCSENKEILYYVKSKKAHTLNNGYIQIDVEIVHTDSICKGYCGGILISIISTGASYIFDYNYGGYNYVDLVSDYKLRNTTIPDVYTTMYPFSESSRETDVRTCYFNRYYGIIAFELFNGEFYELDEEIIK